MADLAISLEQCTATALLGEMQTGRNKAVEVFTTRHTDNSQLKAIVKPGIDPWASMFEWVATAIAFQLGLTPAPPVEVLIVDAFIDAVPGPLRPRFRKSKPSLFGSTVVTGRVQPTHPLDDECRDDAELMLGFDLLVQNPDRREDTQRPNPNFFLRRGGVIPIDHGDSFAFLFALTAADQALDPAHNILTRHWCFPEFKGTAIDFVMFRERLALVTDEVLAAVAASTPEHWDPNGWLNKVVDFVKRRRDGVEQWLPQVQAWIE